MKNLLYFSLLLLFATSCKKEYAYLQKSSEDTFLHKQKSESIQIEALNEANVVASLDDTPTFVEQTPLYAFESKEVVVSERMPTKQLDKPKKKKKSKQVEEKRGWQSKLFPNDEVDGRKPKKKSSGVHFRRWNAMIPTGFILLGVAILLSFISLNSLALLFAVASILFLYLGFKRFFRKRKRQNLFR